MHGAGSSDVDHLSEFDWRSSRAGLLSRYSRGRVGRFASRQIMTFSGGLVLGLTEGWWTGCMAICIALAGEAVDCLYLRSLPSKVKQGVPLRRLERASTVTAALQAISICACVCLAWFGTLSGLSPLFATAFLAGAAINAGLVLPFHRAAGIARLVAYGGVAVGLYVYEIGVVGQFGPELLLNAAGTAMLAFMVCLFLNFVLWGIKKSRQNTRELVELSRDLARHRKDAEKLSLVAKNANDSIFLSDTDGRIVWVNDAFSRITGYSAKEAFGKLPGDLLNGPETDPELVAAIRSAVIHGRPFRGEIQNVTKDGSLIWMETNLVPVLDESGTLEMTVSIEREITEAKRHAQEMISAREAAEEGARAKAEFLATMSHEMRTPMNGVIGMAALLSETRLDTEQRLYVDTIHDSASALLTIINDVLDLSRLDAEKMPLRSEVFCLTDCFRQTVHLLRPQADQKGLSLTLSLTDGLPDTICGDPGRLRQILINLIGNAIKFTESGGVAVCVSVERDKPAVLLSFSVEDSGIGIAKHKIDHVFERFQQADAASTRSYGGTGLGLTISKELIELMGGTVSVTSTEAVGSCFNVVLPVLLAEDADLSVGMNSAEGSNTAMLANRSVLFAEDNQVNRLLIEKYLANSGILLSFAHNGQEAVEMVATLGPDLVFMDMSMPVVNGLEATRLIRARNSPQPVIIALTANAYDSDRASCLAAGMNDFLSKPVSRADLLICMTKHFSGSRKAAAGH